MSNLKIDIIYYKTASDFEMEFNLSGCCRMRMFKDKVETPKGLVNTLARDVTRSKIIIIVTDLFGENNGVSIVSRAIKLPMVELNKSDYGIKTTDIVSIPETAVPLVTKSGIYGGCIIESGPQSIIIVSSMRALRHEIMKAYVHNYVFDVGQLMAYQERMGTGENVMPSASSIGKHASADTVSNTNTAESANAENTQDISSSSNEDNKFTIVSPGVDSTGEINLPENEFSLGENKPIKKGKKKGKATNIVLLIIVILLLIGFGVLAYYFVYLPILDKPGVFTNGSENIITEFLNGLFS